MSHVAQLVFLADPALADAAQDWLRQLACQYSVSKHTQIAYRHEIRVFLVFLTQHQGRLVNFSDLTAEIVSLDISSDDWEEDYFWVTNESGYIIKFNSNSDYNDKLFVFVDKFSDVIEQFLSKNSDICLIIFDSLSS